MSEPQPVWIRCSEAHWPWYLAGVLAFLSFGFTEMMGSDLWWHLAAGREVVQNATPWLVDDWSFTELGSPWHNHEWLADLAFFGWAFIAGVESLAVWKWLVIVATFLVLQKTLLRLGDSHAAALISSIAAAAIAAPFLDMRPQLYTLLGVAVLLYLTLDRKAHLRELLPLFFVWANTHGGFVFGLMLLVIMIAPWRDLRGSAIRQASLTVLLCVLVCLLNPDFVRIFWLPIVYAFTESPYQGLAEWRSPFIAGGITSPWYVYSLMVAAALVCLQLLPGIRRRVSVPIEVILAVLLTAAMSGTSRRFIILWAIAVALLFQPYLAAVLKQQQLRPALLPLLLLIGLWAGWKTSNYSLRPAVAYHYLTAEYAYPHGLAEFVEQNKLSGNTFAYYNWGGFLHWRTDGALKVFIDGRANTLFDDDTYRYYVAVAGARPGWLERVEDSDAQLFLWPRGRGGQRLITGLLNTGRWIQLYEDARGVLLARKGFPLPPTLRLPKGTLASDLAEARTASRKGDYERAAAAANRALAARPWDRAACSAVKRAKQIAGDQEQAQAVMQNCRRYFASRFLTI